MWAIPEHAENLTLPRGEREQLVLRMLQQPWRLIRDVCVGRQQAADKLRAIRRSRFDSSHYDKFISTFQTRILAAVTCVRTLLKGMTES